MLSYIKKVPGKGLVYRKNDHLRIEAYSDSGYAGDKGDRKSSFGYCFYVGGNLVTWHSKQQNVVSRSSTESKYQSMVHTACEMM